MPLLRVVSAGGPGFPLGLAGIITMFAVADSARAGVPGEASPHHRLNGIMNRHGRGVGQPDGACRVNRLRFIRRIS